MEEKAHRRVHTVLVNVLLHRTRQTCGRGGIARRRIVFAVVGQLENCHTELSNPWQRWGTGSRLPLLDQPR